MTERHEVQGFHEELHGIKTELEYEANTRPGNGSEISKLLLDAAAKVAEAMALVGEADTMLALHYEKGIL